ncbi:PA domain-containing protein [Filimonas lacunae]|uniref:PA domain-containing protein n=1 Tax=Filimonas lacunae TaxID=477680 RepID=A0A173MQB2_9BACT|nr:M28 family peptidase [Filimonas lacunae]BAV09834.1 aminopeptidase [Filimonas lacunae]SIS79661.1 PA domain-containing protein [Filimonas lacunae]
MQKLFMTLALLGTIATGSVAQKSKPAVKMSKAVTAAGLKEKLTIVASAEMEGRETATAGQRRAATYIEGIFKQLGLQPGNKDSFQQSFPVYIDTLSASSLLINNTPLVFGEDFAIGLQSVTDTTVSFKEIVLAGYGITDSIYDDYKDLDVKGKLVLIAEGEPKLENGNYLLTGTDKHSRNANQYVKLANARKHGAALVLFYQQAMLKAPQVKSGMYNKARTANNIGANLVTVNAKVLETIVKGFSTDIDEMISTGHSLSTTIATDVKVSLKREAKLLSSTNVIGILPGTDKKEEYVFVTGHYDHLGVRGDKIFYGADDDGSGTVTVLQLAEAFVAAKAKGYAPRRSMVFMTVSGEEKGLWGSEFFSDHPTVNLDSVTVDLNIDMIGRLDPAYKNSDSTKHIYVVGDDKLSSDLTPITDSINKNYVKLTLDRKFNDPKDPNRIYYRSDHYNFARKGVPIIFYFDGIHNDYHQPSDTVDKILFNTMEKRARLVFFTAWDMVNRENMLKRDIPLK